MTTPSHAGPGQPVGTKSDGLLARISAFFGSTGTPAYAGAGQPSSAMDGGILRGVSTPTYAVAPPKEPVTAVASDPAVTAEASVEPSLICPIDPAALAAGQIAIVIPRDR